MSKISIRFFNDREVRAIWDEANSKWWFSAIDIIRAINKENDYVKAGNYWRWLKKKLTTGGVQLVSVTHEFKFEAPDGKKRAADALDNECVEILAKHYPNNRANAFLGWFTYSDNTIDGQSKKKAYTFMESNIIADGDIGTVKAYSRFMPISSAVSMTLPARSAQRPSVKAVSPSVLQNTSHTSCKR